MSGAERGADGGRRPTRRRASRPRAPGIAGDPIWPSGPGARCARTTAPDGDAWASFPHDHARSRAYRWNEDGMAGISDVFDRVCLALALWNGRDPILKERMFGLTNRRAITARTPRSAGGTSTRCPAAPGCAGGTTTPRPPSPTTTSSRENARRSKDEPEYELLDTGVFDDDRYWIVGGPLRQGGPRRHPDARHGHATPGPRADTLHVLPTLWFRNTWAPDATSPPRPCLRALADGACHRRLAHPELGDYELLDRGRAGWQASRSCCSARTRPTRRASTARRPPRRTPRTASTTTSSLAPPRSTRSRPGTKAAAWYQV